MSSENWLIWNTEQVLSIRFKEGWLILQVSIYKKYSCLPYFKIWFVKGKNFIVTNCSWNTIPVSGLNLTLLVRKNCKFGKLLLFQQKNIMLICLQRGEKTLSARITELLPNTKELSGQNGGTTHRNLNHFLLSAICLLWTLKIFW